ncbi:hypothetical protein PIB30_014381 [Stylosanthes scabra]|uniref:FRIGIDA-like protein n=1 Tax=Stylosanthes scabra TaxID=79078 RepID=A0ABU6T6Z2_9FABA|nr:hypothetical protein [Stylosanthes scabra]
MTSQDKNHSFVEKGISEVEGGSQDSIGNGKRLLEQDKLAYLRSSAKKLKVSVLGASNSTELVSSEQDLVEKEPALVQYSIEELSKELESKRKQVCSIQQEWSSYSWDLTIKRREYEAIKRDIQRCHKQYEAKGNQLNQMQKLMGECGKHLRLKENQYVRELETMQKVINDREKLHKEMLREFEEYDGQIEEKEAELHLMEDLRRECEEELKVEQKEVLLVLDNMDTERKWKEKKLKDLSEKIAKCTKELKAKEGEIGAMQKMIEAEAEKLQLENRKLVKVISLNRYHHVQLKELQAKEKQFAARMEELESKANQVEEQAKELESKEKHYEEQVNELNSKKSQIDSKGKEIQLREEELKSQVEDFVLKKVHFDYKLIELDSKEKQYEEQVNELNSQKSQIDGKEKELKTIEKELKSQVKEFALSKEDFECKLKELESREKEIQSKEQFEGQVEELKSRENKIEVQTKELESKEKQLKRREKNLWFEEITFELKNNQFEEKRKELELKMQQFELSKKSGTVENVQDNQSSPASDVISFQFFSNDEETDFDNSILVYLRSQSDPAELMVEIMKDPMLPFCSQGDQSHIFLLGLLMRISPNIKSHVREEAMKFALYLKANLRATSEHSLRVLGFLMILSIYGLVSSFDEDEVLKLLETVSQHKEAVELFRVLGFVDKIHDFVENLIKNQQYIGAVRFICAYELAEKYQPVHLLQAHVNKEKLNYENSYKKNKSIETKIEAIDEGISSLETVLQCISENKIECKELVEEIEDHIVGLKKAYFLGDKANIKEC